MPRGRGRKKTAVSTTMRMDGLTHMGKKRGKRKGGKSRY